MSLDKIKQRYKLDESKREEEWQRILKHCCDKDQLILEQLKFTAFTLIVNNSTVRQEQGLINYTEYLELNMTRYGNLFLSEASSGMPRANVTNLDFLEIAELIHLKLD
jgi:hypothetical protein